MEFYVTEKENAVAELTGLCGKQVECWADVCCWHERGHVTHGETETKEIKLTFLGSQRVVKVAFA